MKGKLIISIMMGFLMMSVAIACRGEVTTPIPNKGFLPQPIETEAPDDIVHTPGGDAYRANVHQMGVPDKWPSIQSVYVTPGDINIHYRSSIETKAGEIRNNIISVYNNEGQFIDNDLSLYSVAVPDGISLTDIGGGGRPGMLLTVLAIEISLGVTSGQYSFQIGIQIDGEDYGTIPCTVQVIE